MSQGCPYCLQGGAGCPSISPKELSFMCTRDRDHEGDHVACASSKHSVASWPNEDYLSLDDVVADLQEIEKDLR